MSLAERHFACSDIRNSIMPFIGCPSLTDDAKACKDSLTDNIYIDSLYGNTYDCNYYCLRRCTGHMLAHIFKDKPTQIITEEKTIINIEEIRITIDEGDLTFTYESAGHRKGWTSSQSRFKLTPLEAGRILCNYLRDHPDEIEIKFEIITTNGFDIGKLQEEEFREFDTSYIRPNNEWNASVDIDYDEEGGSATGYVTTSFYI